MPLLTALAALFVGCSPVEKIESYQVTKPAVLAKEYFPNSAPEAASADNAASSTDRMMGAIVPHGSQLWFFKLAGPDDPVAKKAEQFIEFIASIHFADADAPPDWTLPDGWTRMPGGGMRFATIEIATAAQPLELSVITLPKPEESDVAADAVLSNVNRWRGQMGLPALKRDELAKETKPMNVGGETATIVSLRGKLKGGMSAAPFAPFAGGSLPPVHPDLPPGHRDLPPDHPQLPPGHPDLPDDSQLPPGNSALPPGHPTPGQAAPPPDHPAIPN